MTPDEPMRIAATAVLALLCVPAFAETPLPSEGTDIQQVLAHPLFSDTYMCAEHAAGELPYPGDDLGQDCMIVSFGDSDEGGFQKLYGTDGATNEDWYGWNRPVQSPCDCEVVDVHTNAVTNRPGEPNPSRASGVVLKAADGTRFVVAHLREIGVEVGARVKAGDRLGRVGNNGYARAPHIHIGAWRDKQALQIRWDLRAINIH